EAYPRQSWPFAIRPFLDQDNNSFFFVSNPAPTYICPSRHASTDKVLDYAGGRQNDSWLFANRPQDVTKGLSTTMMLGEVAAVQAPPMAPPPNRNTAPSDGGIFFFDGIFSFPELTTPIFPAPSFEGGPLPVRDPATADFALTPGQATP